MQVHGYKYLQDCRRPFGSCKPNEEWTHITEKNFLYEMVNIG